MYRLTIGDLTVGQAQLGKEVGRSDKIFGRSDPRILEIAGGQLPSVAAGVSEASGSDEPSAIVWPPAGSRQVSGNGGTPMTKDDVKASMTAMK
jgi:hypothetical protein